MVKQFTIPCQFGHETSPVTLYIGHPEATHHPVKFQSDWLSSAKNGTIPQDLMDTLQKLHDLANANGADFEELCYYALISATQHGSGGANPNDINKYAEEFIKKEQENSNNEHQENNTTGATNANNNNVKDADQVFENVKTKTAEQQQEEDKNLQELGNIKDETQTKEKMQPTINKSQSESDTSNTDNTTKQDLDHDTKQDVSINDIMSNIDTSGAVALTINTDSDLLEDVSLDDETLLLDDNDEFN